MNNRLSIYVSSPDSYSDVLDVYLRCFKKYWGDCSYELILTTNSRHYDGMKCICNNKPGDTWVERTLAALPQITSKYILMMCDDILISNKVQKERIEHILDYMDQCNIKYCRLKPLKRGYSIPEIPYLSKVNRQVPYAINLQIGIFRLDFLKELLGDGTLSAWDIENKLNTLASKAEDCLFPDVISANSSIIPFVHGVYKGKWFHNAIKYIKHEYPDYQFIRPFLPINLEAKIKLIYFLQDHISPKNRRVLKKIGKWLGVKFVTTN